MDKSSPAISVIIPVYNTEPYLAECFASVIQQHFRDVEIIVVNDGSTDGSLSVITRYMKKDGRMVLLDKKNEGTGPARNDGIRAARGDYLLFLDADDCLAPDALEILYADMRKAPCDVLIFNGRSFWDSTAGRRWDAKPYFALGPSDENINYTGLQCISRTGGQIQQPGMKMYDRRFLDDHRIAFSDACAGEDYYFFYASMIHAKKVRYFHLTGYYRRYRPGSSVTDPSIRSTHERIASFKYIASTLEIVKTPEDKVLLGRQHAYYASVLWVRSLARADQKERSLLLEEFSAAGLDIFIAQNRHDWKLAALYRVISLPAAYMPLQRLAAHFLRRLYRSRTRLL